MVIQEEIATMTQDGTNQHVAIIGGGIAGMAAAWYLQEQGIPYTLLEQSERWGGKIHTEVVEHEQGKFVVEAGPDSFISQKPWAKQLAQAIGFGDELLGTNDDRRNTYVLNKGKLTSLPDGVMLIVPTKFMPFALSPLFSPLGKLRMGLELFIPPKRDNEDESLADFIRRRLGSEALVKLAEPLMAGIYNTDVEYHSLMATFPRFRALEQKYGSITRGMLAARKNAPPPPPSGKKPSIFTSFANGMESFIDALVAVLTGDLRLNMGVESITRDNGDYTLTLQDKSQLSATSVIMAVPAYVAADLLGDVAPDAIDILEKTRYVNTGTITMAFRDSDVPRPIEGFGVVIPRSEQRPINALTCSSIKFDHRAPDGTLLVRAFFGGSRTPASMDLDDAALEPVVRNELQDLMGITVDPLFTRIYRWHKANPQYDVGHLDRMDAIEAALPENLYLAGSAYRGIGVPDCVHQAQLAVEKIGEIVTTE